MRCASGPILVIPFGHIPSVRQEDMAERKEPRKISDLVKEIKGHPRYPDFDYDACARITVAASETPFPKSRYMQAEDNRYLRKTWRYLYADADFPCG